jgi:hypothetical protein
VGDGKPGPVTRDIQRRYLGIARGELPDPYGWRTPVPMPASNGRLARPERTEPLPVG